MRKDGLERMNKAYGNNFCRLDFDSEFEYITKISEFLMEFFLHELIRHIARHTYKSQEYILIKDGMENRIIREVEKAKIDTSESDYLGK